MQLAAERWFGFGTIAVIAIAAAVPAMMPRHHHRHHRHHHDVDFTPRGCSDIVQPPRAEPIVAPGASPTPATPDQDPYRHVFDQARPQFAHCFGDEQRVELLVQIGSDGHVIAVSHRPDPSTPASRCLSAIVSHLTFPRDDTSITIRIPLTRP